MAACAAPGGRGEAKDGGPDPSVVAVQAFVRICGRLDRTTVMSQAAGHGFQALRPGTLSPAVESEFAGRNATMLVRPQSNGPSLLFWEDVPHCELSPAGVDPVAVEAEFERMLRAIGASQGITLVRATPGQLAQVPTNGPLRPKIMAIAAPNALLPGAGRSFSLFTGALADGRPRVTMVSRGVVPSAGLAPPLLSREGKRRSRCPGRY
jgi:hypothetical protein